MIFSTRIQLFILLSTSFPAIISECKNSYMTICDNVEDLKNLKNLETLHELMVGSDGANMSTVNLMNILPYGKLHKMTNFIINGAINRLEKVYGFQCVYESPLKYLTLYGNELKVIEAYHFPLLQLKRLSLVNNKIESLERDAFLYYDIEAIDLSDNLMEEVESGALSSMDVAKTVTIKNNKLTHIEPGSFAPSLETLNLDQNRLRFVQNEVFQNLINLKELTLSHNKFTEIPKIGHLEHLVVFDMSFNSIGRVEAGHFDKMTDLKFLDLSSNKITDGFVLGSLAVPVKQPNLTISLAFNGLRDLNLTDVVLENKTLVLYGNPFECKRFTRLKTDLKGHESACDLASFSSGKVPFCFDFVLGDYWLNERWREDLKRFHEVVRRSADLSNCDSELNWYRWLYPISYGCVG